MNWTCRVHLRAALEVRLADIQRSNLKPKRIGQPQATEWRAYCALLDWRYFLFDFGTKKHIKLDEDGSERAFFSSLISPKYSTWWIKIITMRCRPVRHLNRKNERKAWKSSRNRPQMATTERTDGRTIRYQSVSLLLLVLFFLKLFFGCFYFLARFPTNTNSRTGGGVSRAGNSRPQKKRDFF